MLCESICNKCTVQVQAMSQRLQDSTQPYMNASLTVYGDMRGFTGMVSNTSKVADGGAMAPSKT